MTIQEQVVEIIATTGKEEKSILLAELQQEIERAQSIVTHLRLLMEKEIKHANLQKQN